MTVQNTGPGNVSNSYGQRNTIRPNQIDRGVSGRDTSTEFSANIPNKRKSSITALIPLVPSFVATASILTHRLLTTAPGDFDAVAVVVLNSDTSASTIDLCSIAVTERSDTDISKTTPIINGVAYNANAAAGTQSGWIPVTFDGGSSSCSTPAGTLASPKLKISDWIPLSSIPRKDNPDGFPLVMVQEYFNNRSISAFQFVPSSETQVFNSKYAPYEWYQTAQIGVDGVTTPASFTTGWTSTTGTAVVRIFGLAYRLRGTGEYILVVGDSIIHSLGAGDTTTIGDGGNNADNQISGWVPLTMLSLANKKRPVGWFNAGAGGKSSNLYLQSYKDYISIIHPSIGVYPVYTPNDNPTTVAVISSEMSKASDFLDVSCSNGIIPVPVTPVPYSGAVDEQLRVLVVNNLNTMPGVYVMDANAAVNNPILASSSYWRPEMTVDKTHPSKLGYATIAKTTAIPLFKKLTA